jgi:hypothetical protein
MSDIGNTESEVTLEQLARRVGDIQAETARVRADAEAVSAENARLSQRLANIEGNGLGAVAGAVPSATAALADATEDAQRRQLVSRRGALRALGGVAAGGVGLAVGSALLGVEPAAAVTPDGGVTLGGNNTATSLTEIDVSGVSPTDLTGFYAIGAGGYPGVRGDGGSSGGMGIYGQGGTGSGAGGQAFGGKPNGDGFQGTGTGTGRGIVGVGGPSSGTGVAGFTVGTQQFPQPFPVGVLGNSTGGIGVIGFDDTTGQGVAGSSGSGPGMWGASDSGPGVVGTSNDVGLPDGLDGFGVAGESAGGVGVYGRDLSTGSGVTGTSDEGVGVKASSTKGRGLVAEGGTYGVVAVGALAPLYLSPLRTVGPPISTDDLRLKGEVYVDDDGAVYVCTVGGSPGTWRQLAGGAPRYFNKIGVAGALGQAGSVNLLKTAVRIFNPAVAHSPAAPSRAAGVLHAGNPQTLQITGTKVDSIAVPAGAVGVIGTVTVVEPSGAGDIRLYPEAGSVPGTTNLTFSKKVSASNFCVVALNAAGQISIEAVTSATNATLDVTGFIF